MSPTAIVPLSAMALTAIVTCESEMLLVINDAAYVKTLSVEPGALIAAACEVASRLVDDLKYASDLQARLHVFPL